MILLNLMYGEVVLRAKGDHQLTGYSQIYFGSWGKLIAMLSLIIGLYGALLAYLIQIGRFAAELATVGNPLVWSIIFFVFASVAVLRGVRFIAELEIFLAMGFAVLLLVLFGGALPKIDLINYASFRPQNILAPFGVLLFALTGASVIPEVEEVLRRSHSKLKRAILYGSVVPLAIYLLFATTVIGVSGAMTSEDAITGLIGILPRGVIAGGALLGILTMGSSFLTLAYILREVWYRDYHIVRPLAWGLAVFPPLILFALGLSSFFRVLQFTGALTGGMTGILISALYLCAIRAKGDESAYRLNLPVVIVWALILVFAGGMFTGF